MPRRAEELECWQLANELRAEVIAICEQPYVARRMKFCDGFTEAAGSVCHNIREGFVRFSSRSIVQFFTYALASIEEVEDYLLESQQKKYLDEKRFKELLDLAEHTRATTLNFMKPHIKKAREARRT